MSNVTVAIPVRDGGELLADTLRALERQTVEHELLVCDSGSRDDSVAIAREHGARVVEIAPAQFSHGRARNLLMHESAGAHVALLTQDAEPAREDWLASLLEGFALGEDVAIVCGPYQPRPDASFAVRVELERWFRSLSPDGAPTIERLAVDQRATPAIEFVGRRGFFTDANACVSRAAWERVPFRDVPYAEDRVLALDMLRAGYAKAYVPDAAVMHSHGYTPLQELRRCFDEWRGLREVYGWREPARPAQLARRVRGEVASARRAAAVAGPAVASPRATLAAVSLRQLVRLAGAVLGSRADRLPAGVRRRLSLERRASFAPLVLDAASRPPRDGAGVR
jgi:glycosyltransferase involved in cell wall biosynthesis